MGDLMLGNEAIARGAYEAGVKVGTAYPGTPSTEIIENLSRYPGVYTEWAPNEKVALEVGIGSSIAGARTLVAMKHVGVNVAADPLLTLAYTGVSGGLVLITADDPGMHSSQNEQDNRGYARMAKLPILEPSDSQEAKDMVRLSLELSEEYDSPVLLRITTRLAHSQSIVETAEPSQVELKPYQKDAAKYVMLPVNARARHAKVEERRQKLEELAETIPINRIEWGDRRIGIITSGVVYQYAKEVLPDASYLKLGMTNPLPRRLIEEFVRGVETAYVIEELEPIIEESVRSWGLPVHGKDLMPRMGELSPEIIANRVLGETVSISHPAPAALPPRPPMMCPGCPHRGMFFELNRSKVVVSGDIGCYTLGASPPLSSMDTTICMGASIGAALGMEKARGKEFARKLVAVIGDSTFIHSGITPLVDVVYNGGTTTVIILDNRTTAMTGHQNHPGTGKRVSGETAPSLDLEALVRAIGIERVRVIDPLNVKETRQVLKEELAAEAPSVIISRRPCVLIDKTVRPPLAVDQEKCNGCTACIRTGCPGLELYEEKKVRINTQFCTSCTLCAQICPLDAIVEGGTANG
ncbi:MAG: indolepyruvate ferredoxin oxidoreductase subunit alpha [Firmicutes bacterium]|nr:indolepyruvate ferredoxin oxidoreductase subunit alpha [Bacillota bacterium]